MAQPQFDKRLAPDEQLTVVQAIQQFRQEAEDARYTRMEQSRRNRDVYLGRQDWSNKLTGQSTEFLPKVSVSVEQMSAFVKRGLVQFGDWFSVDVDNTLAEVISGAQIVRILDKGFLSNLWDHNGRTQAFPTVLSDGVKVGLLESLMIFKVHGGTSAVRRFYVEPGEVILDEEAGTVSRTEQKLTSDEESQWRLRIDLVRPEDYYPDPTGNGLYEIHRVERDLHEVLAMAEDGVYDMKAVRQLIDTDYTRDEGETRRPQDMNQDDPGPQPSFRKRVTLDEFWGSLLRPDGTIIHRNVVACVANDQYLIRHPEPNPFWHHESPFVAAPLIRVPFSVWHKALYDQATQLNLALNEMFNLMLDGGMAAVWGIKQVRLDDLDDPSQVAGGINQGATLAVKSTLPHGMKVLENITEGEVPQDAMAIFEFLNREYTQAALTNELKLGALPPKQVRSAEIMEASSSQAVTMDGLISDMESTCIVNILRKAWLTVLQNADELPPDMLANLTDKKAAMLIMRASPAERFALFANRTSFRVHGLSATLTAAKDFQKIMAMLQAVTVNPMLFQAFMMKFSPDTTLRRLMHALNINPDDIQKTQEELANLAAEMERTMAASQITGGAGGEQGGMGGGAGQPGLQSNVNQQMRPATGMAFNA